MCPTCRYQKCLTIGMRTDLVLDTETRRRRFGNLSKNQEDDTEKRQSVLSVSDESSDGDFQIPSVTESQEEDYTTKESILDPETGILDSCSEFSPEPESHKDRITCNEKLHRELVSSTSKTKESTNLEDIPNRKWGIEDGDAQLSYYIHKKFRKQTKMEEVNDNLIEKESIVDIALLSQSEDRLNLQLCLKKSSTEFGRFQR